MSPLVPGLCKGRVEGVKDLAKVNEELQTTKSCTQSMIVRP